MGEMAGDSGQGAIAGDHPVTGSAGIQPQELVSEGRYPGGFSLITWVKLPVRQDRFSGVIGNRGGCPLLA
jgi:hypothetical protein